MFRPIAVAAFLISLLSLGVSIAAYHRPATVISPAPMSAATDPFCAPLGDNAWSRWDVSCQVQR